MAHTHAKCVPQIIPEYQNLGCDGYCPAHGRQTRSSRMPPHRWLFPDSRSLVLVHFLWKRFGGFYVSYRGQMIPLFESRLTFHHLTDIYQRSDMIPNTSRLKREVSSWPGISVHPHQ